jgi:hypothetical protein
LLFDEKTLFYSFSPSSSSREFVSLPPSTWAWPLPESNTGGREEGTEEWKEVLCVDASLEGMEDLDLTLNDALVSGILL